MDKFLTGEIKVENIPAKINNGGDATDGKRKYRHKFLRIGKEKIDKAKKNVDEIWTTIQKSMNLNGNIPDVMYCIMSSEGQVRVPSQMKAFLQKVMKCATLSGALIVTCGISHGITEMISEILDELEKTHHGFCLQKKIHMVAIVPETQIANWDPNKRTVEKNQTIIDYAYPSSPASGQGPLEIKHHDYFILVENDTPNKEDNFLKASEIAVSLFGHFKNKYANTLSLYIPKSGNEGRQFSWVCDKCNGRIVGSGFHCHACVDFDLCLVCKENNNWKDGHDDTHKSDIIEFDTWNTGHYAPKSNSEGSWRCTSCGLHIWDKIYWCNRQKVCKEDVHCGECHKWNKCQTKHTGHKNEELAHTDNQPASVTWFLLQGGKVELKAGCEALKKNISLLTTYMDGGLSAEMVAFLCAQRSGAYSSDETTPPEAPANMIRNMVASSLETHGTGSIDGAKEYEDCLKEIWKAWDAYNPVINCGIDVNEEGLCNIITNSVFKAAKDSPQARLQYAIQEDDLQRATDILDSHVERQSVQYKDVMLTALVLNKTNFVRLFLRKGMPLEPFCNKETLKKLYHCVLYYDDILKTKSNSCIRLIKRIIKDRTGKDMSGNQDELLEIIADLIGKLTRGIFHPDYADANSHVYCEKDLYLWALLCGRIEMAKVIWTKTSNPVALAILGSKVLRRLKRKAKAFDESYQVEALQKGESELAEIAKGCIQECYMEDKKKSHLLLMAPVPYLNAECTYNCLNLAWVYNIKEFIAKSSCQTKLTNMWNGKDRKYATENPNVRKLERFLFAPKTQFVWNIFTMLMLLIMFTIYVLTDLHPFGVNGIPSILEMIVMVWVLLLTIEELRLIAYVDRVGMLRVLKGWLQLQWNPIKVCMLGLFWLSVTLRFAVPPEYFVFVRIVYSVTLLFSYLNLLPLCFANDKLGPKLIMIKGMVQELMIFVFVLIIFMVAFGTAYEALVNPNSSDNFKLFGYIAYRSYFQMLGNLLTDDIEFKGMDTTCNKPTDPACVLEVFIPILNAVYVLIANVLLLNLLIAVFGFYIEDIQKQSDVVWRFYRYGLIKEYHNKAPFFPFGCLFYWIYLICQQCVDGNKRSRNIFNGKALTEEQIEEVAVFEHDVVTENLDKLIDIKVEKDKNEEDE